MVATPIGNLGDMTPRAVEVLQSVDLIAAEDTRHSAKLMQAYNIDTPMRPYHDHSGEEVVVRFIESLQQGQSMALISDAGTPLVSDPGYRLVDAAISAGVQVVPIPGACAAIAALSAAGLPSNRFIFAGFLPAKSAARQASLASYKSETGTSIFYEAPHRILASLEDMLAVFGGERRVVLARELSKNYETIRRDNLADIVAWVKEDSNQQRGECVLLLEGVSENKETEALSPESQRTMAILMEELPLKQAAALTAKITDSKKKLCYDFGVSIKNND